jgi:hypothetical protein
MISNELPMNDRRRQNRSLKERIEKYGHVARVRPMKTNWRFESGEWKSESTDPKYWEIVCVPCHDSDGPAEQQSKAVRTLRGPYRSRRQAQRASDKHLYKSGKKGTVVPGEI